MARYKCLAGISWRTDDQPEGVQHRAEIGDVVDHLRPESIGWLLEQGAIEETDEPLSEKQTRKINVIPVTEAPVEDDTPPIETTAPLEPVTDEAEEIEAEKEEE